VEVIGAHAGDAAMHNVAQVTKEAKELLVERRNVWLKSQAVKLATTVEDFWDSVVEIFRLVFWDKRLQFTFSSEVADNEEGVSTLYLLLGGTIRIASMTACLLDGVCPGFEINMCFMDASDIERIWNQRSDTTRKWPVKRKACVDMFDFDRKFYSVSTFEAPAEFQWPQKVVFKTSEAGGWTYSSDMCYDRNVFKKKLIPYFMLMVREFGASTSYGYSSIIGQLEDARTEYPADYEEQPTRRSGSQAAVFEVVSVVNTDRIVYRDDTLSTDTRRVLETTRTAEKKIFAREQTWIDADQTHKRGYVYAAWIPSIEGCDIVKIGATLSESSYDRLNTLSDEAGGIGYRIIACLPSLDALALEKECHAFFDSSRVWNAADGRGTAFFEQTNKAVANYFHSIAWDQ
jgi:hypothetical protein